MHGLDPIDLDSVQVAELHAAMFRRRLFEAKLDAAQLLLMLSEALGKKKQISPDEMLALMGEHL